MEFFRFVFPNSTRFFYSPFYTIGITKDESRPEGPLTSAPGPGTALEEAHLDNNSD